MAQFMVVQPMKLLKEATVPEDHNQCCWLPFAVPSVYPQGWYGDVCIHRHTMAASGIMDGMKYIWRNCLDPH